MDITEILRSAEETRRRRGFVRSSLGAQGVVEGVTCTAKMFEGELRELTGWDFDGAVVTLSARGQVVEAHASIPRSSRSAS